MSITKERISAKIAEELEISSDLARIHLEKLLEIMKNALAKDQEVLISGFGKFAVKNKKSRQGRNPKTGEPLDLRARRVVTFKLSGVLRKQLCDQVDKPQDEG
ncbi:MAG: integration host factor subunit alpha [Deltaproteobacteria bacterium]|jgi:integration host factor subunit alpha|nr:integration host factor subunit alpha [Deltaproteobacteria bacterium]